MGLVEQHFIENSAVKEFEEGEKLSMGHSFFLLLVWKAQPAKGECQDVGVEEGRGCVVASCGTRGHEWLWQFDSTATAMPGAAAMSQLCKQSWRSQKGPAEPEAPGPAARGLGGVEVGGCPLFRHKPYLQGSAFLARIQCKMSEKRVKVANSSLSGNVNPLLAPAAPHLCSITFTCLAVVSSMDMGPILLCAHF